MRTDLKNEQRDFMLSSWQYRGGMEEADNSSAEYKEYARNYQEVVTSGAFRHENEWKRRDIQKDNRSLVNRFQLMSVHYRCTTEVKAIIVRKHMWYTKDFADSDMRSGYEILKKTGNGRVLSNILGEESRSVN